MLDDRANTILTLSREGKTLQEIGDMFDISKQRVKQILNEYFPDIPKQERGKQKQVKERKQKRVLELQHKFNRSTYRGISPLEARYSRFFSRKRQNCLGSKNWDFEITMSDLEWPSHCPVLGVELDWFTDKVKENSPSLDRIDSKKGYIPGNVMIMSWRANRIKNDGTAAEHKKIAEFLEKIENAS